MEIFKNQEVISFYEKGQSGKKICDDKFFNTFFKMIAEIDLKDASLILEVGDSYKLTLESNTSSSLKIIFELWNTQINIYLGKEEVHYADDADVVDQKDVDELNANMSLLLNSKIVETLSYKHDVLKQFKYQFFDKNSKQSEFSNGGFSLGKRDKVINEYSPWRKEPGIL